MNRERQEGKKGTLRSLALPFSVHGRMREGEKEEGETFLSSSLLLRLRSVPVSPLMETAAWKKTKGELSHC